MEWYRKTSIWLCRNKEQQAKLRFPLQMIHKKQHAQGWFLSLSTRLEATATAATRSHVLPTSVRTTHEQNGSATFFLGDYMEKDRQKALQKKKKKKPFTADRITEKTFFPFQKLGAHCFCCSHCCFWENISLLAAWSIMAANAKKRNLLKKTSGEICIICCYTDSYDTLLSPLLANSHENSVHVERAGEWHIYLLFVHLFRSAIKLVDTGWARCILATLGIVRVDIALQAYFALLLTKLWHL